MTYLSLTVASYVLYVCYIDFQCHIALKLCARITDYIYIITNVLFQLMSKVINSCPPDNILL